MKVRTLKKRCSRYERAGSLASRQPSRRRQAATLDASRLVLEACNKVPRRRRDPMLKLRCTRVALCHLSLALDGLAATMLDKVREAGRGVVDAT